MKPFDQLTDRGKVRRLTPLARAAIAHWPIEVARLRLLADDTNTLFRVDATDGTRYALRVGNPHDLSRNQISAEAAWLAHLTAVDPELGAPRALPTRDGASWANVSAPGVPQARDCCLLTWVPGKPIGKDATPAQYRALGVVAARMHVAAESFVRPADFDPLLWKEVLYFAGDELVMFDKSTDHLFTTAQRDVLRAAMVRCQAALDRAWAIEPHRVLHGDLHPWNVHHVRDRVLPLDFADISFGPLIQDVAISLSYLKKRPDFGALSDAFEAGYTTLRPWPAPDAELMDALQKARWLNFVNYVARLIPNEHPSLPRRCAQIERWMNGEAV